MNVDAYNEAAQAAQARLDSEEAEEEHEEEDDRRRDDVVEPGHWSLRSPTCRWTSAPKIESELGKDRPIFQHFCRNLREFFTRYMPNTPMACNIESLKVVYQHINLSRNPLTSAPDSSLQYCVHPLSVTGGPPRV
jgi:hypothetical protein